jgi:hypothetical protein
LRRRLFLTNREDAKGAKEEGREKREEREGTGLTTDAVRDIRLF